MKGKPNVSFLENIASAERAMSSKAPVPLRTLEAVPGRSFVLVDTGLLVFMGFTY